MKLKLITAAALMSSSVLAQDMDNVEIRTELVRDNIHVLYGAGGNIGVSVGEDGVYIIDDQYAPLSEKIKAAIKKLSDKPVRFVINTHYHGDHTGGNENFGKAGSVIVAHDNIRMRLTQGSFIKVFNMKRPPIEGAALPVVTFNDEMSLHLNGDEARLIHVANAHTDGVLFYTYPIIVAVAAVRIYGEPLGGLRIGAIVVASVGMVMLLFEPGGRADIDALGVLFAFGAAACQTGYALVAARGSHPCQRYSRRPSCAESQRWSTSS